MAFPAGALGDIDLDGYNRLTLAELAETYGVTAGEQIIERRDLDGDGFVRRELVLETQDDEDEDDD